MNFACCNCTAAAPAFLTQGAFFVDSVNGSDTNDGASAAEPIRSLAELERRWQGKVLSPALASVTIQLINSFPTEHLVLDFAFSASGQVVTVKGTMAVFDSGTVTAIQAWDGTVAGADGQRGRITDATQDFTASVLKTIRLTGGANIGARSNVASLGGGVTLANTGQFTSTTITTVNPAINDTYDVLNYSTTILSYSINASGPGTVRVEDLQVIATSAQRCSGDVNKSANNLVFFGCRFEGTAAALNIGGAQRFASCSFEGTLVSTTWGNTNFLNCVFFNFIQLNNTNSLLQACLFEGGGARNAALFVGNGCYVEAIGGSGNFATAHYGVINGTATAHITLEDQAQYVLSNAAGQTIGSTGNATTNAFRIRNGCEASYVTKPKFVEAPAGVANLVQASAAAIAWAAVPAAVAAPNTAQMNVRQ